MFQTAEQQYKAFTHKENHLKALKKKAKDKDIEEIKKLELELNSMPKGALHRPMDDLEWLNYSSSHARTATFKSQFYRKQEATVSQDVIGSMKGNETDISNRPARRTSNNSFWPKQTTDFVLRRLAGLICNTARRIRQWRRTEASSRLRCG
eukprot:SAG31_NODE_841_length_11595_cov_3.739388_5_plen_151_part_00